MGAEEKKDHQKLAKGKLCKYICKEIIYDVMMVLVSGDSIVVCVNYDTGSVI